MSRVILLAALIFLSNAASANIANIDKAKTVGALDRLIHRVQNVTYLGPCGASWTNSAGQTGPCAPTQRPICYNNGGCGCQTDNACR